MFPLATDQWSFLSLLIFYPPLFSLLITDSNVTYDHCDASEYLSCTIKDYLLATAGVVMILLGNFASYTLKVFKWHLNVGLLTMLLYGTMFLFYEGHLFLMFVLKDIACPEAWCHFITDHTVCVPGGGPAFNIQPRQQKSVAYTANHNSRNTVRGLSAVSLSKMCFYL